MPDQIVDTALLDLVGENGIQQLHVRCKPEKSHVTESCIPVYAKGMPKPCEPCWCYQIVGTMIHVTPSLHIRYQIPTERGVEPSWITQFHNDYAWSVKFKVLDPKDETPIYIQLRRLAGITDR